MKIIRNLAGWKKAVPESGQDSLLKAEVPERFRPFYREPLFWFFLAVIIALFVFALLNPEAGGQVEKQVYYAP